MPDAGIEQTRQLELPPRGVLGIPERLPFDVRRWAPADDLAWCVERFWVSSWALPAGRSFVTRILPHPAVNVTLEDGALRVTGIAAGVWSRRLEGTRRAFGVKFHPGAFHAFTAVPVAAISGDGQSAHGVVPDSARLERLLDAAEDDDDRAAIVEGYLRDQDVGPTDTLRLVQLAVDRLINDPEVRRVADACVQAGVSQRTLERLFVEYLGVSPGWVLRRGRLHAAAERVIHVAATGSDGTWADVAAEFGYADQAHFVRDFRRVLGVTPAGWAAALLTEAPA